MLGSWSVTGTRIKSVSSFHGLLWCLCAPYLQFFRIFVAAFCISGRDFYRIIDVITRSALIPFVYLFFIILCPASALPSPFTQSFVHVTCLNPCTAKHVGGIVCIFAATNSEQYFIFNHVKASKPHGVLELG